MSRVLVIKNADFVTNRVAVIDLSASVPCTGISLAETAITVVNDQPVTVEYTVTPVDTTDAIRWTSSDETVATVNSGVVTILGIGETILTASCGSFSDSLMLTVDIYASPDWYASSPQIITDSSQNSVVRADLGTAATARLMAAQKEENSDYTLPFLNGNNNDLVAMPIKIPNNTDKIHIAASKLYNSSNTILFVNALEETTYSGTAPSCKALSSETLPTASNAINTDVSVPANANGFCIALRLKTAPESGVSITEAGTSTNLSVHFVAE